MSSSNGQTALRPLPVSPQSPKRSLASYSLPKPLEADKKHLGGTVGDGLEVWKVTKTGKLQSRRLGFSKDHRSIFVTTNRIRSIKGLFKYALPQTRETNAKVIDLSTIERIQRGQLSKRFIMARKEEARLTNGSNGSSSNIVSMDQNNKCLSILYSAPNDHHSFDFLSKRQGVWLESLDLVIPRIQDYEPLVSALEDLLELYHEEKRRYSTDVLVLQHHWIALEKQIPDLLYANEWMQLCDRLNVALKKTHLQTLFKEFTKEFQVEDAGLTFADVADLLEDVRDASLEYCGIQHSNDPIQRIWKSITETDPVPALKVCEGGDGDSLVELQVHTEGEETISAVAFLSFLRAEQKEYKKSLEDAVELIHLLNNQVSVDDLDKRGKFNFEQDTKIASFERLSKSRFISFLMSDSNDVLNPALGVAGVQDMRKPLSHYFINTSHDTYLSGLSDSFQGNNVLAETGDSHHTTDEQMYFAALYRGVRCLEVDVWDGLDGDEPVVARHQPQLATATDSFVLFSDILQIIRSFLQKHPDSFPIIVNIENHCSLAVQEKMAKQLKDILASEDLLASHDNVSPLPSPAVLRGKVVIMGKRPKVIVEGAKVMNDDFDDENDFTSETPFPMESSEHYEDEEEDDDDMLEENGTVLGFDANGPIRSARVVEGGLSPAELLQIAEKEAQEAKMEAIATRRRAKQLRDEASFNESLTATLVQETGLTADEIKARAAGESPTEDMESEGVEIQYSVDGTEPGKYHISSGEEEPHDEGLEVDEFIGNSVEGARSNFSVADAEAIHAAQKSNVALERLKSVEAVHEEAMQDLEASYQRQRDLAQESSRAASEARKQREYADSARRRVETVRELLRNSLKNATSAETVVVTAMTEAKISEQRASETEARASRALATAERDRTRADEETKKEDYLEQEVAELHAECVESTQEAREARERVEKAATMLERVKEQIKLIERSKQFQREIREIRERRMMQDDASLTERPRHGSRFVDKHATKLEELNLCKELIKEASAESSEAEVRRRRVQAAFEEKAKMWKVQAERASQVRKQADRSSLAAEELAEHAEEEREAATLRHIAREKAEKNVEESDAHRASVQEQLLEAERASEEAASQAVEARKRAEELAREAELAKDHSACLRRVEETEAIVDAVRKEFEAVDAIRREKEAVAMDAKRVLDTSTEVYSSTKREVAEEQNRAHAGRLAVKNAIVAYNKALLTRKQADHASQLAELASNTAREKEAAANRAFEYKIKTDRITKISLALATMTLLHTSKHRNWEKSISLPFFHMHSMSQGVVQGMLKNKADAQAARYQFREFTKNHLCRTFPSWKEAGSYNSFNNDPLSQWSLGCQLVSMNFHSADENLLVADGFFRRNGSCGYVLKPDYLFSSGDSQTHEERWRFKVLSGYRLPKPHAHGSRKNIVGSTHHVNPIVTIRLRDADSSAKATEYSTSPAFRNGFNPVWNEEKDAEFTVSNPSLAVLVFSVWDMTSSGYREFIASASVPVSCLREGYRSVALFDSQHSRAGPYAFSSLLIKARKLSV